MIQINLTLRELLCVKRALKNWASHTIIKEHILDFIQNLIKKIDKIIDEIYIREGVYVYKRNKRKNT